MRIALETRTPESPPVMTLTVIPVSFVNSSKIPSSGVNASYAKRVTVAGFFSTFSDVEEVHAASDGLFT